MKKSSKSSKFVLCWLFTICHVCEWCGLISSSERAKQGCNQYSAFNKQESKPATHFANNSPDSSLWVYTAFCTELWFVYKWGRHDRNHWVLQYSTVPRGIYRSMKGTSTAVCSLLLIYYECQYPLVIQAEVEVYCACYVTCSTQFLW